LLDGTSRLALLDDGRFVAAPTTSPGEAAVFDSIGAPARSFGRKGSGPGELGLINSLSSWPGDSVVLFESFRWDFLGGARGSGRNVVLGKSIVGFESAVLPVDRLIVFTNHYRTTAQFLVLDPSGTIVRGMGIPQDSGTSYSRAAALGAARRQHAFWSGASHYRHFLELWSTDGTRLAAFDQSPAWFKSYEDEELQDSYAKGDLVTKPLPFLREVREATLGTVWMLFGVATKNWTPQTTPEPRPRRPTHDHYHPRAWDAVFDLIDAKTGRVRLAERTDRPFGGFINDTLVFDRNELQDGTWHFVVYKVQFRTAESR
jgi:hypothetical protein